MELARQWGTSEAADARLAAALRELHGERVDTDDARQVTEEASMIAAENGLLRVRDARGEAIARFAANARRLREGEITPAEFQEIVRRDERRTGEDPRWQPGA